MIELHVDSRELVDWERVYRQAPAQINQVISRVLNHVGGTARTKVKTALAKQTGLKAGTVDVGLRSIKATPGRQSYEIVASGRPISLAQFDPRQTRRGVSARPWGKRRLFPSTFIVRSLSGQVFRRESKARLPIVKLWGPSLPRELLRDNVPKAFVQEVQLKLPVRVEHELKRVLRK